jgi:hypothetical protein
MVRRCSLLGGGKQIVVEAYCRSHIQSISVRHKYVSLYTHGCVSCNLRNSAQARCG